MTSFPLPPQLVHCANCGWPNPGPTCQVCGALPGAERYVGDLPAESLLRDPDTRRYPELARAFKAQANRNWPAMVSECLAVIGVTSPPVNNPVTGKGWAFVADSAAVFVYFDPTGAVLCIDSPILRVPSRHRVPLMRTLLSLNARSLGSARFCLRGELVLLRFVDRLENLNPPKVVAALKEVAMLADSVDDLLSITYAAPMVGPEAQAQNLDWSYLGQPRQLSALMPGANPNQGHATVGTARIGVGPVHSEGLRRLWSSIVKEYDRALTSGTSAQELAELLRAAHYLALYDYREVAPFEINAMCALHTSILSERPFDPSAARGASVTLRAICTGRVDAPGDTWTAPVFAGPADAAAELGPVVSRLLDDSSSPLLRFPIALGCVAELVSRAALPAELLKWIREGFERARELGPCEAGVRAACDLVRGALPGALR